MFQQDQTTIKNQVLTWSRDLTRSEYLSKEEAERFKGQIARRMEFQLFRCLNGGVSGCGFRWYLNWKVDLSLFDGYFIVFQVIRQNGAVKDFRL